MKSANAPRGVFLLVSILASASAGAAQRPPAWAKLTVPGGVVSTNIQQLGKTLHYVEPGRLRVFSAFTREWASTPLSSSATLRNANDWLLITDGLSLTAFSAYRGTFETLTATAGAAIVNPASQRNDSILLVRDGQTLHAFSAFRGNWVSQPVSASAIAAVQRHTAVVADGSTLLGMSAFSGRWVQKTHPVSPTSVVADGTVGIVEDANFIHAFSAQRESWSTTPALPVSQRQIRSDCVVWWNGANCLGFSGLRGAFATTNLFGSITVQMDEQVAVASSGTSYAFFSAPLAAWTTFNTTTVAIISVRSAAAMLNEAGKLYAYSPMRGTIATLGPTTTSDSINSAVAAGVETSTNLPHLYSAITGAWVPAPAGSATGLPLTVGNGALVQTSTGYAAFSVRRGRFVHLAVPQPSAPLVDLSSSVIGVEETTKLHLFEPRRDVWITVPKTTTSPLMSVIWRTTFVADEARRGIGYSVFRGTPETIDMTEDIVQRGANSESARIVGATTIAGFGCTPDLTTLWQFPEFRRVYAGGLPLELQLRAKPGSPAVSLGGFLAPTPVQVPPFGEFFLGTAGLFVASAGLTDQDGRAVIRLPIPADPALAGLEVFFQAVVAPTSGTPYLSDLTSVYLY